MQWAGRRDPSSDGWDSTLSLDAIRFPPQTVFANSRLSADIAQAAIMLGPGEISHLPLTLSSLDGKFIQFEALLLPETAKPCLASEPYLTCPNQGFTPGTEELFLFTLHNSLPTLSLRRIRLSLPEGAVASFASNFTLAGQDPIPFTGNLGSWTNLTWESATGNDADSLRSGVRFVTDTGLMNLDWGYRIEGIDSEGAVSVTEGLMTIPGSGQAPDCVSVSPRVGQVWDDGQALLTLTANQNLLPCDQLSYTLLIYYNGGQSLSIPQSVTYDSDPPGFFATPRLSVYPNPARQSATFAYAVPTDGQTELAVFNCRGQRVRTMFSAFAPKGYHRLA